MFAIFTMTLFNMVKRRFVSPHRISSYINPKQTFNIRRHAFAYLCNLDSLVLAFLFSRYICATSSTFSSTAF